MVFSHLTMPIVYTAMGMAMLISPNEVLVGKYFRKRRSLALALAKCGVSLGNMATPPLITFLLDQYGLSGTLLLYGAVCLHSVPAGMLLRPTSFYSKRHRRRQRVSDVTRGEEKKKPHGGVNGFSSGGSRSGAQPAASDAGSDSVVLHASHGDGLGGSCVISITEIASDGRPVQHRKLPSFFRSTSEAPRPTELLAQDDVVALAKSNPELAPSSRLGPFRKRTLSESVGRHHGLDTPQTRRRPGLLETISQSSVMRYMSASSLDVGAITVPQSVPAADTASLTAGQGREGGGDSGRDSACSCWRVVKAVLCCPVNLLSMLDFSLFRRPLFRLLLGYIMFAPFANAAIDYLPALAEETGVAENQRALLITIIGALDLVCRLSSGFIADLRVLRVSTMVAISFSTLAVVMQFVRWMTSFQHLVALAVLQGLLGGVGNCLFAVMVIDFVGLENMGKGIGFCQLASGAAMAALYPFLGETAGTGRGGERGAKGGGGGWGGAVLIKTK